MLDDIKIIPDATHAESPTVDQMETLAQFFAEFADNAVPAEPASAALIAMNTGMALSFLNEAADGRFGLTFNGLGGAIKSELGLIRRNDVGLAWQYDIVNLDRRSVLRLGLLPALFDGMLDKLDPNNQQGVLFAEGEACAACEAREACFVRTNIDTLSVPAVREISLNSSGKRRSTAKST